MSADDKTDSSAISDIKITLILLLCGGVNAVNIAKLAPSIPVLQAQFSLSLSQIGLLASMFSVLILLTGVAIAGMVRLIGAKRIILLALIVAAIGNGLSLAGQNIESLFAGRIIEGVSLITVMLTAPSLIAQHTSIRRRGMVMGIWGGFMPFGNAAVLLFAPILLDRGSWQAVWIAGLGVTILVWFLTLWIIPADRQASQKSFNYPAILQAVRLPVLAILGLSFGAHSLIYQSLLQFMPLFNQQIAGLSLQMASAFAACFCLLNFGGNVFSGQMIQKGIAPEKIVLAAGFSTAGFIALLSLLTQLPVLFITILMVIGFLTGWLPPVCFYLVGQQTDMAENIPVYNAWMFQIQATGMLCGPVLISWVVETTHNWTFGLAGLVPFCLFIALLALALKRWRKN
jgi:MFS family permease